MGSGVRKYQSIDLMIWVILLFVFEFITVKAGSVWFSSQPWSLSIVPALTAIVYMRWGAYGILYAFLGGISVSFASDASTEQYVIYAFGNLLSALLLLFFRIRGKAGVRDKTSLSVIFALSSALLMQTGRGIVSVILGYDAGGIIGFISTDILSTAFSVLIVLITRKLDGVFEDQISYLIRVNNEEKEKGGRE
ncbi:MAG: hypothetical protein ACI4NM_04875 [Bullifex sp.]